MDGVVGSQIRTLEAVVQGLYWVMLVVLCLTSGLAAGEKAFTINGVTTTVQQIAANEKAAFYEIEKRRYQFIEQQARQKYLDVFWQQRAKKSKKSIAQEKKRLF